MRGVKTTQAQLNKAAALLATGMGTEQIAKKLGIGKATLDSYRRQIEKSESFKKVNERLKKESDEFVDKVVADVDSAVASASKVIADNLAEYVGRKDIPTAELKNVASIFGIAVDKRALMMGKATTIVGGQVNIVRFEDL